MEREHLTLGEGVGPSPDPLGRFGLLERQKEKDQVKDDLRLRVGSIEFSRDESHRPRRRLKTEV